MISVRRRGVTLVELLTVLAVVSLLALLVLPSVKTLLTDRKSTSSATMVRNFLEAARAHAVGSGMPVAVVFERLSSVPADINGDGLINESDLVPMPNPQPSRLISATATDPLPAAAPIDTNFLPYNASIRMSMAEQPLPVTDEMITQPAPPMSKITFSQGTQAGAPPSIVRFGMDYFFCRGGGTNLVLKQFLVAGNEISLNLASSRHMITQTATAQDPMDSTISNLWFTVPSIDGNNPTLEQAIPSTRLYGLGTTNFTIYPKPRPVNGPAVQLPKGTCVDLSLSGFSTKGNIAGRDQRMRFSTTWLYGGTTAPNASEIRPIYIVFTPDGGLSRIYANSMGGDLIPIENADDFFLHIGKIDQVVATPGFFNVNAVASITTSIPQNITDLSTYIVRLSPKSGAISVAPVTSVAANGTIGDVLELSRQGTYGAPLSGQ